MRTTPLGPVAGKFFACNGELDVIVGPVGSGKSTASCLRTGRHAYGQKPFNYGAGAASRYIAKTRFAIVRNTKPQLRDTTMKTWFQVFPEALYGERQVTDYQHRWRFRPQGFQHEIEAEFLFRGLDTEADVAELLSLEVTGFYFNEIRQAVQQVVAHARKRAGRFPPAEEGGCTWKGIFADSNAWHDQHWLHELFVNEPTRDKTANLFRQPSGLSPDAENLENLNQTPETAALPYDDPRRREQGRLYYTQHSYSPEDARVYIENEWGSTREGKPIYTEYRDLQHCQRFELDPRIPLDIGIDFGRTPAAAIGQCTPGGAWRIRWELCTEDTGIRKFGEMLARFLARVAPDFKIGRVTGDPSGIAKDGSEHTAFQLLAASGIICKPARTNDPSIRVEAVQGALRRTTEGVPALLIHPDCAILRTAMIDGYHYRRLTKTGNYYAEEPEKNDYSHVAEGLQYLLLGGGEGAVALGRNRGGRQLGRPAYTLT